MTLFHVSWKEEKTHILWWACAGVGNRYNSSSPWLVPKGTTCKQFWNPSHPSGKICPVATHSIGCVNQTSCRFCKHKCDSYSTTQEGGKMERPWVGYWRSHYLLNPCKTCTACSTERSPPYLTSKKKNTTGDLDLEAFFFLWTVRELKHTLEASPGEYTHVYGSQCVQPASGFIYFFLNLIFLLAYFLSPLILLFVLSCGGINR